MKLKLPPCKKCLYKLGGVQTLVDPCPACKMNGWNMYDMFSTPVQKKESESSTETFE
ncbi:MAG: hypothetical protein R3Y63_07530 [Eubacteriales bacterium]